MLSLLETHIGNARSERVRNEGKRAPGGGERLRQIHLLSGLDTEALDHFPHRDEMLEASGRTLLGRMVGAVDIAKVVAFLCTEDAAMIRGQVIMVDGGAFLGAGSPIT